MNHRVVVVALLDGPRVLLGHRSPTRHWYPNVWDFPGGHVEDGETLVAALAREIHEELGVDIELDEVTPALTLSAEVAAVELTIWATRTWRGTVHNEQPHEHDELGWFTLEECDDLTMADEAYRPLLRRLLRGDAAAGS